MEEIKFYTTRGDHGCFSNFSRHHVFIDGKVWLTSEHYYQAMKFEDEYYQEMVRETETPREAADLGRNPAMPMREDWDDVKDDFMRKVVYAKFTQHIPQQTILLNTGDATLIEHTKRDSYWGDGGDGTGKNMLGKILMETREKIREEDKANESDDE